MGSRLPPYPAYRDSGLGWLPQVPTHWDVRRNGRLFAQRVETGREELPILEVSLRTGVRVRSFGEGGRKQVMADRAKYKRAATGDIAYNMMRLWQGAVGVVPEDGLVSPAYVVAAPYEGVEPRYFAYLFRTGDYMREVEAFSRGIVADRNRLYWGQFKQMPSPYPPLEEQRRVADYLDAHGRLAHRLIRNRRRLLAVLKERRQAIINDAVTQGVDPAAIMQATPLDSIPMIPAHWQLKRLKYLTRFSNGIAFKPTDWKDAGTPIIRIENLNGSDEFNYTDRTDLPERLLIQPGDLLFAWSGNRGTSFGSFEWDRTFPAYLNQHIFKLEHFSLHRRFFFYALRAVTKRVEDNAHGIIGLVHVTKPELGAIEVPVPPPVEQEAIADHLDRVLGEVNAAAEKLVREIKLVEEYRERLIVDAVTGRLDVRDAVIATPLAEDGADSATRDDEEPEVPDDTEAEDDAEAALAEAEE